MSRPNITEELERLIDASTLLDVLTGLELVCAEKAEHIRRNWQDGHTAKLWGIASRKIGATARAIPQI